MFHKAFIPQKETSQYLQTQADTKPCLLLFDLHGSTANGKKKMKVESILYFNSFVVSELLQLQNQQAKSVLSYVSKAR